MKKTIQLWLSLSCLLSLLGLVGCRGSNEPSNEPEPLTVSQTSLSFASQGGEETLTVSGSKEWSYLSNVPEGQWMTLTQDNDMLVVRVSPNTAGTPRRAAIMVLGDRSNQKIEVSQSATDATISFGGSKEVVFGNKAEERIVSVDTNLEHWTVEPLDEEAGKWLSVVASDEARVLVVRTKPNPTYEARSASLIVRAENGARLALTVTQKGVEKYILPYTPTRGYRVIDMITYERDRGFVLQAFQEPGYDTLEEKEVPMIAQYLTTSDYMPVLVYVQEQGDPKYTMAQTLLLDEDNVARTQTKEYMKFLEANNYEFLKDESQELVKIYHRKDELMRAEIRLMDEGSIITFRPLYPQDRDYPTFDRVPVGPEGLLAMLHNPGVKYPEVKTFEEKLGSTLSKGIRNPEMSEDDPSLYAFASFSVKDEGEKREGVRSYWFYTEPHKQVPDLLQTVLEVALYFRNPDLALRSEGRNVFVTQEFEKLLLADGYSYDYRGKNGAFFYWKRIDAQWVRQLYVQLVRYSDVFDGSTSLQVGYFDIYEPEQQSGGAASVALRCARHGDYAPFVTLCERGTRPESHR